MKENQINKGKQCADTIKAVQFLRYIYIYKHMVLFIYWVNVLALALTKFGNHILGTLMRIRHPQGRKYIVLAIQLVLWKLVE
jgi:hypothetical protein